MNVFVVRDSACGQGDDDPGQVLGVFTSETEAIEFAEKKWAESKEPRYSTYCVDVEGPFPLN